VLRTSAPDIQDQLDYFESKVLVRLLLAKAGTANDFKTASMEVESEPLLLSDFGLKVLEQTMRAEVDSLNQLLLDLYLGQLLLQKSTKQLHERRLQRLENWIRQVAAA